MTLLFTTPGSSTATTHLGFGCSQLMGGITRRESIALLETAFEAGIRHYDTAPSYGYGQAERVLGEALRSRRDQVTITTKFGIQPPRNRTLLSLARRVMLPMVKRIPNVRSRLSRAAAGLKGRARFSPEELRSSIEASLVALGTDYIDILLLHEVVVDDLDDRLFAELERSLHQGKIRSFGIGSEVPAMEQIYRKERRFCGVIQFEWSVLSGARPDYSGSFPVTHRSLAENLVRLRAWLGTNPAAAQRWSQELDLDIADASVLSRLMLAAARHANPAGITLFSSRNPGNIRRNARLIAGNSDLEAGTAFTTLVARDAAAILKGYPNPYQRQVESVS